MRLAQLLLLAAATVALGGCSKPNSVVGRWSGGGNSSYVFGEDGIMFHIVPSGARYSGNYYVDSSTSPMLITSRLYPMDGTARARDVTWQAEFLTKDRLRVVFGKPGSKNRPQLLKRVTKEETEAKTGAK
jgi:hypothetical protein